MNALVLVMEMVEGSEVRLDDSEVPLDLSLILRFSFLGGKRGREFVFGRARALNA